MSYSALYSFSMFFVSDMQWDTLSCRPREVNSSFILRWQPRTKIWWFMTSNSKHKQSCNMLDCLLLLLLLQYFVWTVALFSFYTASEIVCCPVRLAIGTWCMDHHAAFRRAFLNFDSEWTVLLNALNKPGSTLDSISLSLLVLFLS